MNERPILFSAPMVRALLEDTKTQTRRIIKPQPISNGFGKPGADTGWEIPCYQDGYPPSAMLWPGETGGMLNGDAGNPWFGFERLWVKETFHNDFEHNRIFYRADASDDGTIPYLMHGEGGFGGGVGEARIRKWTPSLFMRRSYSRITLEITDVRAERLNDITKADAIAEGIESVECGDHEAWKNYLFETAHPRRGVEITDQKHRIVGYESPCASYTSLWESINGTGSWALNPWVWVITFKPTTPTT